MSSVDQLRRGYGLFRERGPLVFGLSALRFLSAAAVRRGERVTHELGLLRTAASHHEETDEPLAACLGAVRRGFTPADYAVLGLATADDATYVSREQRRYVGSAHPGPIMSLNANARHVLHDKLAGYRIFADVADAFPALYGSVHDGRYDSWDDGRSRSLLGAVETYGTVVAKPVDRAEGEGFYRITNEGGFTVNGDPVGRDDVERLQREFDPRDYLVTECLKQHAYARTVFPETANTVRVHTVVDPDTGEPFVASAIHRFGTERSRPVDTFARGGVVAPVDVATGALGPVVVADGTLTRRWSDTHPESGAQVAGVRVPTWEPARDLVLEGARAYPMARLIGWDVLVTDRGPRVLEASGHPHPIGTQLERGLLADPRIRRAFERADGRNAA